MSTFEMPSNYEFPDKMVGIEQKKHKKLPLVCVLKIHESVFSFKTALFFFKRC